MRTLPVTAERRVLGQFFTPPPVARLALAAVSPLPSHARVLDPMCGDGAFLAAARAAGATDLTGVELDGEMAALARRVPSARVVVADALAPRLPEAERLGTFDLVVGNPPYIRAGHIDAALRRERADAIADDWPALPRDLVDTIARHADLSATCLLRALRFVRPGGTLALVVSTALLDADGAGALWTAIERLADVRALVIAPAERWFPDAAVNPMLLVATRRDSTAPSTPRLLRLRTTTEIAAQRVGLDAIAEVSEQRRAPDGDATRWGSLLRAPAAWFDFRAAAGDALVPLRELAEVRRGLTTGANHVFYLRRELAKAERLERKFLAPVVRSPFNGAPAPIAIAPDESPLVAIALPPDHKLSKTPRIASWLARHEAAALATSARRRDPWWSLPANPARLFLAKAYGPRFVQRLADVPMLADQRVYALTPRDGVDLLSLAAVLNALPTALALESLGRGSMGYGVVEWTVHDAMELPVLDVRRATDARRADLASALAVMSRRPVEHVRLERGRPDRAALDGAALSLAPCDPAVLWHALLASVALRDRYLLPSV